MDPDKILKAKRDDDIVRLSELHGAKNFCVLGSVARNEVGPESDIDFLVNLDQGRSLLDLSGLLIDLERLLGRSVGIVETI